MKRTIVLTCVVLLAVVALCAAAGCGSSSSSRAGVYVFKSDPKQTITLTSNGKFTVVQSGAKTSGTWKVSGDKLTLTPSEKGLQPLTVTIKNGTITDPNGGTWTKK